MADTPEGTGLSVNDAASLLTGPADTQEQSEAQQQSKPVEQAGEAGHEPPAPAEEPAAEPPPAQEEHEEGGEQEQEQPAKIRVKNPDGTEAEVTLDELTKGYQRQADYTRKTMELANQRRELEQAAAGLRDQRAQELQIVQLAQQVLAAAMPQEPDWARLAKEDPIGYLQQKAQWDQHQSQLQALQTHEQQTAQQHQAHQVAQLQQQVAREQELLLGAVPEWKNPETAKAEKAKLKEFGKTLGFSEAELNGVIDHRAVNVLRKAMLYDELMAKRPGIEAKTQQQPRIMAPGSARGRSGSKATEVARAHAQLAKTGSVEDAARLLTL